MSGCVIAVQVVREEARQAKGSRSLLGRHDPRPERAPRLERDPFRPRRDDDRSRANDVDRLLPNEAATREARAGRRAENVGPVYRFDPLNPDRSARYNPFATLVCDSETLWEEARSGLFFQAGSWVDDQ
jgi:hypothetical protein